MDNIKTTHTPGPWSANGEPGTDVFFVSSDNETFIAEITTEDLEEREANARLIAAAPDQNDVLCKIVARLDR